MVIDMKQRLYEHVNIMEIIKSVSDFSIRAWNVQVMRFVTTMLGIIIVLGILIEGCVGVVQAVNVEGYLVENIALTVGVLSGLLIIAAIVVFYMFMKTYRLLIVSQFQSMLFANVCTNDAVFCVIFNQEGELIYSDANAQTIFCNSLSKDISFSQFVDFLQCSHTHRNILESSIEASKSSAFRYNFRFPSGREDFIELSLSILKRPANFSVLRGKPVRD